MWKFRIAGIYSLPTQWNIKKKKDSRVINNWTSLAIAYNNALKSTIKRITDNSVNVGFHFRPLNVSNYTVLGLNKLIHEKNLFSFFKKVWKCVFYIG